jgi:hypothetical protein
MENAQKKNMNNPLNVIREIDAFTSIPRIKKEKLKPRRIRRQELRDRVKAAKNNQK